MDIFRHQRALRRLFDNHIRGRVESKKVLDVGFVGEEGADDRDRWMHQFILEEADHVLGIDIAEEAVAELQDAGYNVEVGDVQDLDLGGDRFEVIVMGDVIEHLTNFEGLFRSLDRHLAPGGRVVLTTPNVGSIIWNVRRMIGKEFNRDHTCWFEEQVIQQLLGRFGFEAESIDYARVLGFNLHPVDFWGWLAEVVLPCRIAHQTLVVVGVRKEESGDGSVERGPHRGRSRVR